MIDEYEHMLALEREVSYLKTLLRPSDTGHIHTAISLLEIRIQEIAEELGIGDEEDIERIDNYIADVLDL